MIDFRQSRILDPAWWRRFRLLINGLERSGRTQALEAMFQYHCSLVANGSLTEKSFEKVQQTAQERYFDILGGIRPWEGKTYEDRKGNEFKTARQSYIDILGVDPLDPKFKEWEAKRIEQNRIAAEAAAKVMDPVAEVAKRHKERAAVKMKEKRQRQGDRRA